MSGLFSSLQMARDALQAQQLALEIAQNNIANVNTPGFSRQRPQFVEKLQVREGPLALGRGVEVKEIEAFRDKFIEIRLSQQKQKTGFLTSQRDGLVQLETVFDESSGSGIQDALTAFFSSFLQLSSEPGNSALRQDVLAKANGLASVFRSRSQTLQDLQSQENQRVAKLSKDVNRLTEQISSLNRKNIPLQEGEFEASAIRDRRGQALKDLAELIDISYYETENGSVVVSTTSGRALVTESRSKPLEISNDSQGQARLLMDKTDITAEIKAGKLGSALSLRDSVLPKFHSQLDTLVSDLVTRVNEVHKAGYDLGQPPQLGGDFFTLNAAPVAGSHAAARIEVNISDGRKIAAAATTDQDDNGNAKALFALSSEARGQFSNLTYGEFTSSLTFEIANQTRETIDGLKEEKIVLAQLEQQRESVSGVSIDQEAIDLVRYQRAFEAASRLFSVINDLTDTLLNLVR